MSEAKKNVKPKGGLTPSVSATSFPRAESFTLPKSQSFAAISHNPHLAYFMARSQQPTPPPSIVPKRSTPVKREETNTSNLFSQKSDKKEVRFARASSAELREPLPSEEETRLDIKKRGQDYKLTCHEARLFIKNRGRIYAPSVAEEEFFLNRIPQTRTGTDKDCHNKIKAAMHNLGEIRKKTTTELSIDEINLLEELKKFKEKFESPSGRLLMLKCLFEDSDGSDPDFEITPLVTPK